MLTSLGCLYRSAKAHIKLYIAGTPLNHAPLSSFAKEELTRIDKNNKILSHAWATSALTLAAGVVNIIVSLVKWEIMWALLSYSCLLGIVVCTWLVVYATGHSWRRHRIAVYDNNEHDKRLAARICDRLHAFTETLSLSDIREEPDCKIESKTGGSWRPVSVTYHASGLLSRDVTIILASGHDDEDPYRVTLPSSEAIGRHLRELRDSYVENLVKAETHVYTAICRWDPWRHFDEVWDPNDALRRVIDQLHVASSLGRPLEERPKVVVYGNRWPQAIEVDGAKVVLAPLGTLMSVLQACSTVLEAGEGKESRMIA